MILRAFLHRGIAAFITLSTLAAPPVVTRAVPDDGDEDVDPVLTEIRVTFDQDMNLTAGWSVVGGGPTFPKITAKPKWLDARTIVISVALEPDKEYWLSINNERFTNFRSARGESATPYPISFRTRAANAPAKEPLTAGQKAQALAKLRELIASNYSYRDRLKLDWDQVFKSARPQFDAVKSPRQFAREAGRMLAVAKDLHIWLKAGNATFPSHRRSVRPNAPPTLFADATKSATVANKSVVIRKLEAGTTYVLIASWDNQAKADLEAVFDAIQAAEPAKGIVIDVRLNSGGSELLAQEVAGCFTKRPVVYSKSENIDGHGKFHPPIDRSVAASQNRPTFAGKAVVLMGPYCMSSCESFLLMMKQAGATLVGERSYGSSGNPKPHELGIGVTVFLPSWRDLRPDGTCIEGEGVAPDVEVKASAKELERGDPVLEAGLRELNRAR
jgi:hypothetical protein